MKRRDSCSIRPVILVLVWSAGTLISSAYAEEEPQAKSSRPTVIATLKTGAVLEGRLHRFVDGHYTIVASGRTWHFSEQDAKSISFQKPIPVIAKSRSPQYDALTTAELIEVFAHPASGVRDRSYGDARLIPVLAGRGSDVIRPLMREVAQNSSLYQNAGKVFQLLGPDHFPAMLKELQAGTPGAEKPFYWALQQSGVRGVPVLRQLLEHEDAKVRSFALHTLYNIGIQSGTVLPVSLTPVLLKTLNDPIHDVRRQAPAILAMVARPLDDIMPELLSRVPVDAEGSDIGYDCVLGLKSLGSKIPKSSPWRAKIDLTMREGLSHHNSSIRSSAAQYFGHFSEPPPELTIQALKSATDDPEEYVRKTARATLYKFGISPNRSTDIDQLKKAPDAELVKLLASEDSAAVRNAVQVLQTRKPSPELLELLMQAAANDSKYGYWNQVPRILAEWDAEQAVPWLEEYTTVENHRVRRVVALTYATMPLDELPPSLSRMAQDADMMVRSEAIQTLGKIATQAKGEAFQSAVPVLLKHITDTSIHREYHWRACDALVDVGISHPDVLPRIIRLANKSQNASLRDAMIDALGEIGSDLRPDTEPARQIVETLAKLLADEPSADLKRAAIYAFGYMQSQAPEALAALEKAKDDPRESVSKAATETLQKLRRAKPRSDGSDYQF